MCRCRTGSARRVSGLRLGEVSWLFGVFDFFLGGRERGERMRWEGERRAYGMERRDARRVGELTLIPPRRRARLRCDQQCRPGVGDDVRDVVAGWEVLRRGGRAGGDGQVLGDDVSDIDSFS